jgi:hypothetical protein
MKIFSLTQFLRAFWFNYPIGATFPKIELKSLTKFRLTQHRETRRALAISVERTLDGEIEGWEHLSNAIDSNNLGKIPTEVIYV